MQVLTLDCCYIVWEETSVSPGCPLHSTVCTGPELGWDISTLTHFCSRARLQKTTMNDGELSNCSGANAGHNFLRLFSSSFHMITQN